MRVHGGPWLPGSLAFIVNTLIILSSPTKKLSANRNNNYHFSNLFINSVPIHRRTIYHSSTKIFLSFYNKEENIINYEGKQKLLGSAFQLMHISISKLHTTTQLQHQLPHNTECSETRNLETEIITRMIVEIAAKFRDSFHNILRGHPLALSHTLGTLAKPNRQYPTIITDKCPNSRYVHGV